MSVTWFFFSIFSSPHPWPDGLKPWNKSCYFAVTLKKARRVSGFVHPPPLMAINQGPKSNPPSRICHPPLDAVVHGGGMSVWYFGLWDQISSEFLSTHEHLLEQMPVCE